MGKSEDDLTRKCIEGLTFGNVVIYYGILGETIIGRDDANEGDMNAVKKGA